MKGINESSKKISDIISVIDGIAFQTNILALNAAVEAARAGEQGRGFAVVASEVRSLAGRSAEAAREIKALIDDSVGKVSDGTRQVTQSVQTMTDVVAQVRRVNALISEITGASKEQAIGIAQVGQAVAQLDDMTQQNAAMVEQSSAAAASMRERAQRLMEAVQVFSA
jgi:aerotaxis receptor